MSQSVGYFFLVEFYANRNDDVSRNQCYRQAYRIEWRMFEEERGTYGSPIR